MLEWIKPHRLPPDVIPVHMLSSGHLQFTPGLKCILLHVLFNLCKNIRNATGKILAAWCDKLWLIITYKQIFHVC